MTKPKSSIFSRSLLRRFNSGWLVAALSLVAFTPRLHASPAAAPPDVPPYKNPALPFDKRVADLVSRLTLEEKAEQIQMMVQSNYRLGIPPVHWWSEAIHGVARAGSATVYPEAIAMAATWDPPLIQQIGESIADEARAKYNPSGERYRGLILWSPTVNLARDPRWGRIEETYGEDPYLSGRMGVAMVKGLQGDDPKYLKTVATPKHFAAHSQESNRMSNQNDVSEKLLWDYYLPAFRACFVEGKAASTMAALSGINGVPCAANHWLLTEVLRDQWGFNGAVVSDWTGVTQLGRGQRYVNSMEDGVAAALNAGLDVICDPRPPLDAIINAVNSKLVTEETLDRAVTNSLMLRFRLGMFDPPEMVPFANTPSSVVGSKAHLGLALKSAHESIVLLKNDPAPKGYGFEKLLPLDPRRIRSVAVLGPYANLSQFGAYSGVPANSSPTILSSLRSALGDRIQVRSPDWTNTDAALDAAETADMAIVVLGLNNRIELEGVDRSSLELPYDQRNFLEKIVRANPLTVVILEGGSPIGTSWIKEHVPACLMVWYPGEQGGIATADILLGKTNPSGRLPLTFYRNSDDLPRLSDYDITKGRTYLYLKNPPSYAFGHGLSYTTFAYSNLQITPPAASLTGSAATALSLTIDIANAGALDGEEVVQLYTHSPESADKQPIKQLRAFQRISIPKSESRTVRFSLPLSDLASYDESAHKPIISSGTYDIFIGASSDDIRARSTFTIK